MTVNGTDIHFSFVHECSPVCFRECRDLRHALHRVSHQPPYEIATEVLSFGTAGPPECVAAIGLDVEALERYFEADEPEVKT